MYRIFPYIDEFIYKISNLNSKKDVDMVKFIFKNLPNECFLRNDKNEIEFLDMLYKAIDSDTIYNIKTLKLLCVYKVDKSDISDKLLYIVGGGIKYRTGKNNTWIERRIVLIIDFIDTIYDKIRKKLFYIHLNSLWNNESIFKNIKYEYIPNKDVDFFIDYINLRGYRNINRLKTH